LRRRQVVNRCRLAKLCVFGLVHDIPQEDLVSTLASRLSHSGVEAPLIGREGLGWANP
jgi:hypothetical protein